MTAFVDKPKLLGTNHGPKIYPIRIMSILKEAYELAVSTLFGETAMIFVPLPGSLEIVSVAPICSARSFIPSRPTPPLV